MEITGALGLVSSSRYAIPTKNKSQISRLGIYFIIIKKYTSSDPRAMIFF